MSLKTLSFDRSWSLFLDRDGVINKRIIGGYVTCWEEFHFLPGALAALKSLSGIFGHIFIVTNQQGIGKGLMTHKDLEKVHQQMLKEITGHGGKIDGVFYSPYLASEDNPLRKPATGMALQATRAFPSIDLSKSVMAGDSLTDIQFGKNAGMVTVFISPEGQEGTTPLADDIFPDLSSFAQSLKTT